VKAHNLVRKVGVKTHAGSETDGHVCEESE
jgi:hypothetical protein